MSKFKKCPACGSTVTGNRTYCPEDACARAAQAVRQARYRARIKEPAPEVVPATRRESHEGFRSPWGIVYPTEADAWGDCLIDGGLSGELSEGERMRRFDLMQRA